jgi:DNA-binding IclR family transcriptional regulator
MSALDKILLLLKDGKWHNLKEIAKKMALPKIKTELAVSFLTEHNFILLNEKTKKVRLQPTTKNFIEEIQILEKEEILSH